MDVTDVVGGFGPWQRFILTIIVYRAVPLSFIGTAPLFFVSTTDHWCARPNNLTWTVDEWRNSAIPEENGRPSKCYRYHTYFNDESGDIVIDRNQTVPCKAWEYDEEYGLTLTKQFNLVCGDAWMISLTHTLVKLGNLVCFLPAGYLTDRFGRMRVAFWSFIALLVFNSVSALSPTYTFYLVLRFFIGVAYSSAATASLCLLLEVLGPDHRPKVSFSFIGGWGIGITIIPGVYWLAPNWRHSQLILSIPFTVLLLLLLWRYVPESVRWLLTVNKDDEANKIIVHAAHKNRVHLDHKDIYLKALKQKIFEESSETSKVSYLDLFRNKDVRKWTLVFYLLYFLLAFVYFGFLLTVQALGASLYLTVFLMGVTELIAVGFFMISTRFRRKRALIFLSVFTAAAYLASIPVPDDLVWLRLVLSMMGRLTNIVIYNLIWMVGAEVYPTSHRSLGINGCMAFGRIGTVVSTFLVSVAQVTSSGTWLLVLFGVLMGLSSLLYIMLPETKDKHLPDTMAATKRLTKGGV